VISDALKNDRHARTPCCDNLSSMERRTVQLRVAGQTHRVVTTATDGELKRFVATIEDRLAEVSPRGRAVHPQALLLAALALVHDLEEERERSRRIEARAREALSQLVERIDAALDTTEDAEEPSPVAPGP
jgi:cell division protein ZapA